MKILSQLTLIFVVSLMGEAVSLILPFPLPGSIAALFIMLILLFAGVMKEEYIKETSNFLVGNITIFFIPACVGIIEHLELLKSSWLQILLIASISFLITFALTGYTVKAIIKISRRKS